MSTQHIPQELYKVRRIIVPTKGLPSDNNHDPSNIIKYKNKYYFWYTQHMHEFPFSHFAYTKIMYKESEDGLYWSEGKDALLPSDVGWDNKGVLTPYVVPYNGKYYLFYMGVGDNYVSGKDMSRGSGVAVADSIDGPFIRFGDKPIIMPEKDSWDNDSCDDVTVLYKDNKWWMYYKGSTTGLSAEQTQVGLAFSNCITGPYVKYEGNPLIKGHAFAIWPYKHGFLFLSGLKDEDEGTMYENWHDTSGKQSLYWSEDGIHFERCCEFPNRAAGIYTSVICDGSQQDITKFWGLTVNTVNNHLGRFIERFDFIID